MQNRHATHGPQGPQDSRQKTLPKALRTGPKDVLTPLAYLWQEWSKMGFDGYTLKFLRRGYCWEHKEELDRGNTHA